MIAPAMNRRGRLLLLGGLGLTLVLVWSTRMLQPWDYDYESAWESAKGSLSNLRPPSGSGGSGGLGDDLPPHVATYFDQAFSAGPPGYYAYPALAQACERAEWPASPQDEVFLRCGGMAAGMTSIISQVKVCLKMAVETGSSLVLPSMPLRDSTHLREFNFLNMDAYLVYDEWFDADHLREVMGRACPRMRIAHPAELNASVPVRQRWEVSCANAWGYRKFHSYFWAGRPFKKWFADQLRQLRFIKATEEADAAKAAAATSTSTPKSTTEEEEKKEKEGITVVDIDSEFLLFRITDDPTRGELRLWNDLSTLIRFRPPPREIVHRLLPKLAGRPYYGVHFRVENDTMWSSLENQLALDLDALDAAWAADPSNNHHLSSESESADKKPLVYLACGDQEQVEKFVAAGAARGWEVTHKWRLADPETQSLIDGLAFDFQGLVDLAVLVRAGFFIGITGSAFSSTVANLRDPTGRYRGSSLELPEDDGARSHLFNDLDSDEYACCL